jgi:hypothetical protein
MPRTGPQTAPIALALALATTALLPACGNGNDDGGESKARRPDPKLNLNRPQHPRCGTQGLGKPQVSETPASKQSPRYWSLTYTRRPHPTATAPESTTILIVQLSPRMPPTQLPPNAQTHTINGRQIQIQPQTAKRPTITANWKTNHARYTILATNTTLPTIKRLAACLP